MDKFKCSFCHREIKPTKFVGTSHRNHCPFCLWSKHVDLTKSGDRKAECRGEMLPIGLTFKHEGWDKWGKLKKGEIMLIHRCHRCGKLSINRIAGDDMAEVILNIYEKSKNLDQETKKQLEKEGIRLLEEKDKKEISTQLFGNLPLS